MSIAHGVRYCSCPNCGDKSADTLPDIDANICCHSFNAGVGVANGKTQYGFYAYGAPAGHSHPPMLAECRGLSAAHLVESERHHRPAIRWSVSPGDRTRPAASDASRSRKSTYLPGCSRIFAVAPSDASPRHEKNSHILLDCPHLML